MSKKYDSPLEERAVKAAETILRLHKEVVKDGVDRYPNNFHEQEWHRLDRKQSLRDALECMKHAGLISGYNFETGKADPPPLKKGVLVFVAAGKKVRVT